MYGQTAEDRPRGRPESPVRRIYRAAILVFTFLFVVTALAVSVGLVVYMAWIHDLGRGVFALLFAVLSAQIAINWLLWKEDKEGL